MYIVKCTRACDYYYIGIPTYTYMGEMEKNRIINMENTTPVASWLSWGVFIILYRGRESSPIPDEQRRR